MQRKFRLVPAAAILAFLTLFSACKKEAIKNNDTETALTAEMQTHTDEYNAVSNNLDDVDNEANAAIEASAFLSGRMEGMAGTTGACGTTVSFDTTASPRTITIAYNGNNCAGTFLRTGTIKVLLPAGTRWKNAGAAITLQFQNLQLKRLRDNKSITLNGSQTMTNVTGGLLANLSSLQTVVHTVTSSNMSITFADNTQRTWNISRKRTFTYNNGLVLKISGTGTSGTAVNLTEWGTNRAGHPFSTFISEPLTVRQDCSFRLTSGQIRHEGFGSSTVTFGLNANGESTSCPVTGTYYLKLVWTGPAGTPHTLITPY